MHSVDGNTASGSRQPRSILQSAASIYGKSSGPRQLIDKSSILWKDFMAGIKRRKALVARLRDAAQESSTSIAILKRQLLEVRQLTLTIIEDALEIEYRHQIYDPTSNLTLKSSGAKNSSKLPPISSFKSMEEKEDIFALAEIVTDTDELFHIPNIRVMLPREFPNTRNPFLLGKSIDELALIVPPHPEAGNTEEELKVLELLRYKRASRALIRAECQVSNNLPILLPDLERFSLRMLDDTNVERLIRSVATLLDNDRTDFNKEADIRCLVHPEFTIEGYDILNRINKFKGTHPMRADVQVAVRQLLQDCHFEHLDGDSTFRFIMDWVNLVLGTTGPRTKYHDYDDNSDASVTKRRSNFYEIQQSGASVGKPGESSFLLTNHQLVRQHVPNVDGHPNKRSDPVYNDMTSVVSNSDMRGTHENIYVESAPLMKLRTSSSSRPGSPGAAGGIVTGDNTASLMQQRQQQQGGGGGGGNAGSSNITKAIVAGTRNAMISSSPNSKLRPSSPDYDNLSSPAAAQPPQQWQWQQQQQQQQQPGAFSSPPLLGLGGGGGGGDGGYDGRSIASGTSGGGSHPGNYQQQQQMQQMQQVQQMQQMQQRRASSIHKAPAAGGIRKGANRADNRAQQSSEADMKLRFEVERIVKQMGVVTKGAQKTKLGKDEEDKELDRLSSVRYELHRMQQELLRRQVLDPRHYQVFSVDAIAQAHSGLTVSEINTHAPDEEKRQKLLVAAMKAQKLVTLSEKIVSTVPEGDVRHNVVIEILADLASETIVGRLNEVDETGGEEVEDNLSIIQGVTHKSERQILRKDTFAWTKISKLIYNRLTDYLYSGLENAKTDVKGKMLQNVFDLLQERLMHPEEHDPKPLRGQFLMKANRVLLNHKFTEDGVLVDLVILRNDACDGLVIHATPLAGIYNAAPHTNTVGPVTILLHDKELAVLLINQYGMFVLSRSKWSSMEMVAQWLAGRLVVRKVKTIDTTSQEEDPFPGALPIDAGDGVGRLREGEDGGKNGEFGDLILEQPSFISQVTFEQPSGLLEGRDKSSNKTKTLSSKMDAMNNPPASVKADGASSGLGGLPQSADAGENKSIPATSSKKVVGVTDPMDGSVVFASEGRLAIEAAGEEMVEGGMGGGIVASRPATTSSSQKRPRTSDTAVASTPGNSRPLTSSTSRAASRQSSSRGPRTLVMLDVKLDRHIDISAGLLMQWKSRNVPNIAGMDVKINAWQDLEMLIIQVTLVLPLPHRFNLLKRKKRMEAKKASDLLDMNDYSDEDDEELDEAAYGQVQPVEIVLDYRLTSSELSVFGSAELIEKKKITLSQNTNMSAEQNHPETFIWNVFSRLKIHFKGSKTSPFEKECNANDQENWEIEYVRTLVREVKTVSKGVLILSAHAVGGELMITGDPIDNTVYAKMGQKIMNEHELADTVYTEGWPLSLLDFHERKNLAIRILDKMKVVDADIGDPRLEIYTYPETRMLKIAQFLGAREPNVELGSVEINYHSTLSDVRVLIKHELDVDDVPKQFRFMYKGGSCSVKQEPFRRAWECLPRCLIVPKNVDTSEMGVETEDILRRREKDKDTKKKNKDFELPRLPKGQRRVLGRWSPIPVPTLCRVKENSDQVHLLHNVKDLFSVGDIIRIGNIQGRDYIVLPMPEEDLEAFPRTMKIGPVYDLVEEAEFSAPTVNNFCYPRRNAGKYFDPALQFNFQLLKSPAELGYEFVIPPPKPKPVPKDGEQLLEDEGSVMVNSADGYGGINTASELDSSSVASESNTGPFPITGEKIIMVSSKSGKQVKKRAPNQTFEDCWIWKCISTKEDTRRRWEIQYDNGAVQYAYEHRESMEVETHFRVQAHHAYLEVLVTDSRIRGFTYHAQRIDDMKDFGVDFYTELIFDKMTDWTPTYKKGVERSKFIKLMRDVTAFPDLKRSARISQLEMYFQKIMRSEYGIVQKYINYAGFIQLLKEIAVIRFPPPRRKSVEESATGAGVDGGASVGSLDEASVGSLGSLSVGSAGSAGSYKSARSGGGGEEESKASKGSKGSKGGSKGSKTNSKGGGSRYSQSKRKRRKKEKEDGDDDASVEASAAEMDPVYVMNAYTKFVVEYVMMYPTWYDIVWNQAKLMAMKREAVPYCAATRIAAKFRGGFQRTRYLFFLRNHVKLQSIIRRKFSMRRTWAYIQILREDWCFRMRYHFATLIQTLIRKFCKRCWHHRAMQKIKDQEILVQKARRFRLKKLRMNARKGVLYKELKRVNGVMCFVRLTRKDTRNYSRDCSLVIEAYVPATQATFRFPLEDAELRFYLGLELGIEPTALSMGDLLDKRNLQKLVGSRLIVHKPASKTATTTIVFSKHALGQRGENTFTRGKRIKGEFFVCKIFEAGDDIAVQLYHRFTSKIFNCHMSLPEMHDWIVSEYRTMPGLTELERHETPPILRPGNKNAYYTWILEHLTVDTRRGNFQVMFTIHLLRSRKKEMIIKIQSIWRRAIARPRIVRLLDDILLKVYVNAFDHRVYYLNRLTGQSTWKKSKLLGGYDLPSEPKRAWLPMTYYDEEGYPQMHYVNPYTGQYTRLKLDEAARIIQSLVRNFLLKAIAMPIDHFIRAGKIMKGAEAQYKGTHKRLAAIINYAVTEHVGNLDEAHAKKLYAEAVELSEANPLVTRAYAFFMLGTCEAPLKANRDRSKILFFDAERKDPMHVKFQVAYYMYQFGCIRHPRDHRALVNLALVQCLLYGNNHNAEKLLRRALAISPFEERVMEIWNYLKDRFPERQVLYHPASSVNKVNTKEGQVRTVHGRPVKGNAQWAGWCFVEKDDYNISKKFKDESYWYNPADGQELKQAPDFAEQWIIRKNRSNYEGDFYGLEQYFDPLTSEYYQYHALTKTFS